MDEGPWFVSLGSVIEDGVQDGIAGSDSESLSDSGVEFDDGPYIAF